jgi:ribose/xylose/arabinose/galactoside ABC-type transport system permease subunit
MRPQLGLLLQGRRASTVSNPVVAWAQRNGLFFALVALVAFFAIKSDHFLTSSNVKVILLQISVVGIVAVPGAMLILAGYVDLSIGGVAVMASVVFGKLATEGGLPVWVAFSCALAVGAAWGVLNGILIMYFNLSPIIVTLGGLAGARGVAELLSEGFSTLGFGESFVYLGSGEPAGLPTPVWIFIGTFLVGAYVWYQMPYGRHLTAIGADRGAARSVGVHTKRIPFFGYVASGFAAALGGLIVTSQLDATSVSIGVGLELEVLTAILLGGVAFVGGRGSLFGVLFGALFIGVLTNGLVVINISPYWENIAIGAALVFAAALDVLYQRLERIPVPEAPEPVNRPLDETPISHTGGAR